MSDTTLAPAGGPEGYRLLDMLGRGGFGEVWRAEAPGGVKVAVKILSLALKPAEAKRELAALNTMLELRHPYLLSLQAIFYHGDRIFVVMELADDSLRARLNACRKQGQPGIPTVELLRYLRESAEAIDFLHANKRLHRDIKPDNILLLAGHGKVADYGLARILEQQQTVQTQSVLGTPAYMAPETWEGSVGPRSDQYSLAVVYAELRCGRRPFEARSMPHMAHLHATTDPDLGGLPEVERPILSKALAKKSADRYPTCRAFVTALARAVQAGAAAPLPPTVLAGAAAPSAAKRKAILALPTVIALPANKPGRSKTVGEGTPTRTAPVARPAGAGGTKPPDLGRKPVVLGAVALLMCSLCGGLGYVAWPKSGSDTSKVISGDGRLTGGWKPILDTSKLPPGGSLTGGDLAEVEIAAGVKMTFCWVPPGEAPLGSPKAERLEVLKRIGEEKEPDWLAAEAAEVRGTFKTKGFWLAKYPVTQEQWKGVMGNNPSYFSAGGDGKDSVKGLDTSRFPVEEVCWDDADHKEYSAQEFLRKLNASVKVPATMGKGRFVLPKEDEWEYAARGGRGNKQAFYWGDQLNGDKANGDGNNPYGTDPKPENYKKRTTQVGDYEKVAPHPWGLCDMAGNVYQWCDDKYEKDKDSRVLRDGSWGSDATNCRAAYRYRSDPGNRGYLIGCRPCFRLD